MLTCLDCIYHAFDGDICYCTEIARVISTETISNTDPCIFFRQQKPPVVKVLDDEPF